MVRFTNSYVKPALKGEVANVVSRRGYKAAYSSLFVTTPQSRLAPCQLPLRGSLLARFINSYIKPPSLREVAMSVSELTEGVIFIIPQFCPTVIAKPHFPLPRMHGVMQ